MLTLLLLACNGTTPTDTNDTSDSGTDTVDTGGQDTEPEEQNLWTKYKVDTPTSLRAVYSSGAGVYVFGGHGQAWVGSATQPWEVFAMPKELAGVDVLGLWAQGVGKTLELAVVAENGWFATYSQGAWAASQIGAEDNRAIAGTSLSDLFVVGENGIQHWDGATWTQEASPASEMNAVWTNGTDTWAAGEEGVVLRRSGGGDWAQVDTGRVANLYGIGGVSGTDLWFVGDQGAILRWNGSTWVARLGGTKETLNAVWFAAADAAFAVGNGGVTLRYDGTDWAPTTNDTNQNLYAVHGVSGNNAWAVGNGGLAMQYVNAE